MKKKLISSIHQGDLLVVESRDEIEFGNKFVNNLFSDYKIIPQFPVFEGKYRIDWYIPELKIAVEYDKREHLYKTEKDNMRQKEIEKELGCRFIRYKEEEQII